MHSEGGSSGGSFDSLKEGAAQIGSAVADAASAVATSVGNAASDAKDARPRRRSRSTATSCSPTAS